MANSEKIKQWADGDITIREFLDDYNKEKKRRRILEVIVLALIVAFIITLIL